MWPFISNKKGNSEAEEKILVIDVGSSRIASALVLKKYASLPEIIVRSSYSLNNAEFFDILRYKASLKKGIIHSVNLLTKDKNAGKCHKVFITVSSLVHEISLRRIQVSGLDKKIVTKSLIDNLIDKNINSLLDDKIDSSVLMDKEIMSVSLNGYVSKQFIGKPANSIVINLFLSLIDKEVKDIIVDAVQDCTHLETDKISIHSYEYAAWDALSLIYKHRSYILAEFGGEITDMLEVVDGVIASQVSLPIGTSMVIRNYSKISGKSLGIAESHLKMHYTQKLAKEESDVNINELEEKIHLMLTASLESSDTRSRVETPILLLGNSELNHFVSKALSRFGFNKEKIKILEIGTLNKYCKHRGDSVNDLLLMLSVIFSAKIN